jgi:hypothetical protein
MQFAICSAMNLVKGLIKDFWLATQYSDNSATSGSPVLGYWESLPTQPFKETSE